MKRLNHDHGFALVGVLLVIVLVTTIGLALMPLANNSLKSSQMNEEYQSTFYIAEAGMNMKIAEIEEKAREAYAKMKSKEDFYKHLSEAILGKSTYNMFELVHHGSPIAELDVTVPENQKEGLFLITSKGKIGENTRIVERMIQIDMGNVPNQGLPLPDLAIFTNNIKKLAGGYSIEGDIGITEGGSKNLKENNKQLLNITTVNDNLFPFNYEFPTIPTTYYMLNKNNELKKVGEGINYPKLELNDKDISINIGNTDKVMVINQLILKDAKLTISGEGKLSMFVNEKFSIHKSQINTEDKSSLDLYLYTNDIEFKNNSGFNANIFTNASHIEIEPAKQTHTGLIFAPNADFKQRGGHLHGMVVAKSVDLSGNGGITYGGPYHVKAPGNNLGDKNVNNGPTISKTALREK